ncbi:MAG: MFS transporter [Chloroflexia bacterium]|nr:MFS transporter [Chloroflexia bacterium]
MSSRSISAALLCVLLGSIDLTVVATVVPAVIGDLGVNTADVDRYIWIVSGYLIAYIVAIPLLGRLSDLIGRQRAFILCLLAFLAGSIICGASDTLGQLIAGRVLQGLGGGGLLPVAIALVGDRVERRHYLAAIGVVSAVETVGWVLGPIYGASIVGLLSGAEEPWRWIFWINVPLLLTALGFVWRGFADAPVPPPARGARSLDVAGAMLLTTSLVTFNLALASGGEFGTNQGTGLRAMGGTPNPLADVIPALLAVCAVSTLVLVFRERRARFPLLPIELYGNARFRANIVANLLLGAVLMVAMVNIPVVVALVSIPDDVSRRSALLLAPFTISIAAASLLAGGLIERWGLGRMSRLAVLLVAAGCGLVFAALEENTLFRIAPGLAIAGAGIGLVLPPLGAVVLEAASAENRGAAASSALMFRLLGMTVGVSALTALGIRRLQTLTGRLDPVVQASGESTASFLNRQRIFIEEQAIPLSVQVIQETFLVAGLIAACLIVPLLVLSRRSNVTKGQPQTRSQP